MQTNVRDSGPITFALVGGLTTLALFGTSVPVFGRTEDAVTGTGTVSLQSQASHDSLRLSVRVQESIGRPSAHGSKEPGHLSAQLIKELRTVTDFTWDQLSKLLGVSRRSVHLWAAGGRMAAVNEEAVARLLKEVAALPTADLAERRVQLLSLLDRARTTHASTDRDINRPVATYSGGPGAEA